MNIVKTNIPDVVILEPKVFGDTRGWFTETYNKEKLKDLGIEIDFVQDNHSYSKEKGTLRGIHFQAGDSVQAKLVRVTKGSVIDYAVDLRKESPTYKQWVAVELTAGNHKQLLIPRGFGHAFLTLEEDVEFQYKVDNYYSSVNDRSIRWDDPELNIKWAVENPVLSDKDKNAPLLKDVGELF